MSAKPDSTTDTPDAVSHLIVQGASEHNLKAVSVTVPKQQLVVFTGVSGSGKTSLVFDTIFAEAQRRFIESLSTAARQLLEQAPKPEVDTILGLSPAIAIGQKSVTRSPRATVATIAEIYDYLRVLFARAGVPICPNCDLPIVRHSPQSIANEVQSLPLDTKVQILAPIPRISGETLEGLLESLRRQGFLRVRLGTDVTMLDSAIDFESYANEQVSVVVDRLQVKPDLGNRLTDSIELALKLAAGRMRVLYQAAAGEDQELFFSERYACSVCDYELPELEPRLFSFSSVGACPVCHGIGTAAEEQDSSALQIPCPECRGARLSPAALIVRYRGKNIAELCRQSVSAAKVFFDAEPAAPTKVEAPLLAEIRTRLRFLQDIGLGYLTLDRAAQTLSSGEAQRIRLASQLGGDLNGILYVLDEPTIGLHARDTARLAASLQSLRDHGNTVLVVEHDREIIAAADYVFELGPGAGTEGGNVTFAGTPEQLMKSDASITARHFRDGSAPAVRSRRKAVKWLKLEGARAHNLKNISAEIPLASFVCVTGVSGSGKSTLINHTLLPAVGAALKKEGYIAPDAKLSGAKELTDLISVDQNPIGRTPRSNPASYVGAFGPLREVFAQIPEARVRGYDASRFSFNVKGGRCEHCQGGGLIRVEMHFLPDLFITCPECKGKRYNRDTLEIKYRGYSIADILDLPIREAHQVLLKFSKLESRLRALVEVGLGYLTFGQSATTLSGGEAQRVKLATELARRTQGAALYVFDEPTRGLHPADVSRLLEILHRLVDHGHTVVVIEHNLDIIVSADWCIDLGPGAGDEGGTIVAAGPPEDIARASGSFTGEYLRSRI